MDVKRCERCNEELTLDSDFCPHCGILCEAAGSPSCVRHAASRAIGVCILDHDPGCRECLRDVHGKYLCEDHRNVEIRQDWACAFESNEINDAELVRAVLAGNGLTVLERNFNSVGFVWDGGGDSPISRSNLNKAAKVFVPIPEFQQAVALIEDWQRGNHPEEENEHYYP